MLIRRIWDFAVVGLALMAMVHSSRAQSILSTSELFDEAHRYYDSGYPDADYVKAYGAIMAYIQRNPPPMQDPTFAWRMRQWLDDAYARANAVATTGSVGGSGSQTNSGGGGSGFKPPVNQTPENAKSVQSFRLECRGGGEMQADYFPGAENHRLQIRVTKARAAARVQAPGPGQCARVDRPLNPHDPSLLSWTFDSHNFAIDRVAIVSRDALGGRVEPDRSDNVVGLIMEVRGSSLSRLIEAIEIGRSFAVDCYDDWGGHFVITKVHVSG